MNSLETSSANPPLPVRRVAVIEIGSTAIRMAIAESTPAGEVHMLEQLVQSVAIGEDTYSVGQISRDTIETCVQVLQTYREKLLEYRIVDEESVRIVATSAVREAENTLSFVDRVFIATGWQVKVLDAAELHRIIYQGIQNWREKLHGLGQDRWVIAEVGGGNTEYLVIQHGEIESSSAIRLGSLRLRTTLKLYNASQAKWPSLLRHHAKRALMETGLEESSQQHAQLLLLGGDVRFAAEEVCGVEATQTAAHMQFAQLEAFTNKIVEMKTDEIARRYHLPLVEAETVGPALVANTELARSIGVQQIHVLPATLRDGLLIELIDRDVWSDDLVNQIFRSAIDVGQKFHFDEAHARHVARIARDLFNQLEPLHQLDRTYELLLSLAALLHEIGLYIGTSAYHKHSMYLISFSELFGLSRRQLSLIGLMARYHRRASPKSSHTGFTNLSREDRVAVIKLAAILRVAIALDGSRSQRIHDFECFVEKGRLVITVPGVSDLSMEQLAMRQIGSLFQETFGMGVFLRGDRKDARRKR